MKTGKQPVKWLCMLTLLGLLLGVLPAAAESSTFVLEELDLSLSIPDRYDVFTRDIDPADPRPAQYGITREDLLASFKDNNIYLNATLPANNEEIVVTMVEVGDTGGVDMQSEAFLEQAAEEMISNLSSMDYTVTEHTILPLSQARFIRFSLHANNQCDYMQQYSTVVSGKVINCTIHSYAGPLTDEQAETLATMVESIRFNTPPAAHGQIPSAQRAGSRSISPALSLVFGLLVTIAVYTLPVLLYRCVIRRRPMRPKTAGRFTVLYAIIAFILVSVLCFLLDGSAIIGGGLALWSFVNYKILTFGYQEETPAAGLAGTTIPLTPEFLMSGQILPDAAGSPTLSSPAAGTSAPGAFVPEPPGPDFPSFPSPAPGSAPEAPEPLHFCPRCGAGLSPGDAFCAACGTRLSDGAPPPRI